MGKRMSYPERVFLGEDRGPVSWLIRGLLWPFSIIYLCGLTVYLWLYDAGIRRRCKLDVPVISVGNLTCGGTGKTPAVQAISRALLEQGKRVVVLSRGHGGSVRGVAVASDGDNVLSTSLQVGDEPILLARTLPGVPVVVGKDRRDSGRIALERFAPDVIVLDDGLQYWQLHRDLDVVIVNSRKPFGSGFLFPMGDLREPRSGLCRAGIVLLTGTDSLNAAQIQAVRKAISGVAPDIPVHAANHLPVCVRDTETQAELDAGWLAGRCVFAFCGIGQPDSFMGSLRDTGASVDGNIVFADHHRLSDRDITAIIEGADACGAEAIITTEKDFARLDGRRIPHLHTLVIKLEIEDYHRFAQYISNRSNRQDR